MAAKGELQRFLLRGQVVSLYRSFLRAIRELPESSRGANFARPAGHSHALTDCQQAWTAGLRVCVAGGRSPCITPHRGLHARAGEVRSEMRRGFEQGRDAPDAYATKYLLSDGRMRLKQLEEMIGFRR